MDNMDVDSPELQQPPSPSTSYASGKQRSTRACDHCRKMKNRCERPKNSKNESCIACVAAKIECVSSGPEYKRGPPPGYARNIEHSLLELHALFGAIDMLAEYDSHIKGILEKWREDPRAALIFNRVRRGPYGVDGRTSRLPNATTEEILRLSMEDFATPVDSSPVLPGKRDSRKSREAFSSKEIKLPDLSWQDHLVALVAPISKSYRVIGTTSPVTDEPDNEADNAMGDKSGRLSVDEKQEVRYHGGSSGMQSLGRVQQEREEEPLLYLPNARIWPESNMAAKRPQTALDQKMIRDIILPDALELDNLVDLFFEHIYPSFPVLNKRQFMKEYNERKLNEGSVEIDSIETGKAPLPPQKVTKLLLLAICATAARFVPNGSIFPESQQPGWMWEAGCECFFQARDMLRLVFDSSSTSTLQALLIMGHRQFGLGQSEEGWLYTGLAIRMAFDLGFNCNTSTETWHSASIKEGSKHPLYPRIDTQTRTQVWWCCVLADRFGSLNFGRMISIKDDDFTTPLTSFTEEDIEELNSSNFTFQSVMTCFKAASRLAIILGHILSRAYPVRTKNHTASSLHNLLTSLEGELNEWLRTLPGHLEIEWPFHISVESMNEEETIPYPPHLLFLHLCHTSASLMLYRAFIPDWSEEEFTASKGKDVDSYQAFQKAGEAAKNVIDQAYVYYKCVFKNRISPFFAEQLLHAGIVCILFLRVEPQDPTASAALDKCYNILDDMKFMWPGAYRAQELLKRDDPRTELPYRNPLKRQNPDAEEASTHSHSSEIRHSPHLLLRNVHGQGYRIPPSILTIPPAYPPHYAQPQYSLPYSQYSAEYWGGSYSPYMQGEEQSYPSSSRDSFLGAYSEEEQATGSVYPNLFYPLGSE